MRQSATSAENFKGPDGGKDQGEHGKDRRNADAYTIAAWRCMVVKPGRTGLGGPDDFEVGEGWEDGGERWAGRRVLGVMQREGVVDAVVVVRRWCVVYRVRASEPRLVVAWTSGEFLSNR